MTPLIKELIQQSYEEVPHEREWDSMVSIFNKEKFADLIIRECARVADEGFGTAHFGLGVSGYMIKEHFGIPQ